MAARGVVGWFFIVGAALMCFLFITLVVPRLSTIYYKTWPWWDEPLPPDAIAAFVADTTSSDQDARLHARDLLVHVASECPTIADPLAPSLAQFHEDEDPRVRTSTVEALGRLDAPAIGCEHQTERLPGTSVPHLDHTIDIALAGLRRPVSQSEDRRVYCSLMTRDAVQAALGSGIPPGPHHPPASAICAIKRE